jgi:hypothetical protein
MKNLDEKSDEVMIAPKYVISRFMKSHVAFKIKHFAPVLCSFGILKKDKQLHVHLRYDGTDEINKTQDTLDVDIYIPHEESKKLMLLLQKSCEGDSE